METEAFTARISQFTSTPKIPSWQSLQSSETLSQPFSGSSQSLQPSSYPALAASQITLSSALDLEESALAESSDNLDVDMDNPPALMEVDMDSSDEEDSDIYSLISGSESVLEVEKDGDFSDLEEGEEAKTALERMLNEEYQKMPNLNIAEPFNFLPSKEEDGGYESDSEMDIPESFNEADNHNARKLDRSLVGDKSDTRTWRWHPTAGQILRYESDTFQRWEELFTEIQENHTSSRTSTGYYPFTSRLDWEVAQWAVKEKISQKTFDRLLQIPEVKEHLGLSYGNSRAMLKLVDDIPPRCGQWFTKQLSFRDQLQETFTIHHRDPIEAIKALWGDASLANHLVYKPANLFGSSKQTEEERMFSEMWTGGFWNAVQTCIPEGGTVCPVIIATDKTQLTQFSGSKAAYPVYLTIGNIPKNLRRQPTSRACILIAYLSVDKPSGDKKESTKGLSKTALKMRNYEIFHRSMAHVLEPLKKAGDPNGKGVEMVGGDGAVRRVYPLLATYVADYPEQCLVTCTKSGTCPKCRRKATELELPNIGDPRTQMWTLNVIKKARAETTSSSSRTKATNIHKYGMKHYDVAAGTFDPFWTGFPLADIHRCIAPDILHQCYQGVFKHLVKWIQAIIGEKELDRRLKMLPPSSGVHIFKNGISKLTQLSGAEHKQIAKLLLSSLKGKVSPRGILACKSLLHFIYLAQYPIHDQETLKYMETELKTWNTNRSYFVEQGIRFNFNIPKFHSLSHYVASIKWLGTTDNYNTEMFERLHINFAKEGWRASNKRDHFPQMVQWLSRQEKIASFDFYQSWIDTNDGHEESLAVDNLVPGSSMVTTDSENLSHEDFDFLKLQVKLKQASFDSEPSALAQTYNLETNIQIAKYPHEPRKSLPRIAVSHSAPSFILQLKAYLNSLLPSDQQASRVDLFESSLPFTSLDIWHHFKFLPVNLFDDKSDVVKEVVKAIPSRRKSSGSRYDTVIVMNYNKAGSASVIGCRVARVKVIFCLPKIVDLISGLKTPAPLNWPTVPLAYVEWFTQFEPKPDLITGMFRVKHLPDSTTSRNAQGSIILLSEIRQSC
ncbi:hypothetical protein D9757_011620 [Collybiopsis confluens]|uniref:DUF6830 domain-containing protein n=1 Tax=Collybiopsis confluens TaxID=2823264 RepID=A0A8H5GWL5_9AGAR|nr:hypothetical protein D9757_011620 [Collybiopsis confluens]